MTLKHIYGVLWLCLLTVPSHAQSLVPDSIQDVIEKAETTKNLYSLCLRNIRITKRNFLPHVF